MKGTREMSKRIFHKTPSVSDPKDPSFLGGDCTVVRESLPLPEEVIPFDGFDVSSGISRKTLEKMTESQVLF